MIRSCEVVTCAKESSQGVTLHKIPKDDAIFKLWIDFLEVANRKYSGWKANKKLIYVCSEHFKTDDMSISTTGIRHVKGGKFPCLYEGIDMSNAITPLNVGLDFSSEQTIEVDVHAKCNDVIKAQMNAINELRTKVSKLESTVNTLKQEIADLKRHQIKPLRRSSNGLREAVKRKNDEIVTLKKEVKMAKLETKLPGPELVSDSIITEMVDRRTMPCNQPYSEKLRSFAFNCHYASPKGYRVLRKYLPEVLPDPSRFYWWTKGVEVAPGILAIAVNEIRNTCNSAGTKRYYALAFDELAIRQQVIFNGEKMVGTVDYGGLAKKPKTPTIAKSALFCLATEVNGSKAFPLAYILTDGLKSDVLAAVVEKYIQAVIGANGNVLTVSFDGLKSNFTGVERLGASLCVDSENYKTTIDVDDTSVYVMPDACHMFKLVRNTLQTCRVLIDCDGKEIKWKYIVELEQLQEREELRAGNKLSSRHVDFKQNKMNVKLALQTIASNRMATSLTACRMMGIAEFEGSEATSEFFRVNNATFDLLNTIPFGSGSRAALSRRDNERWHSIICAAKRYYTGLQVLIKNEPVLLYKTKYKTCVIGIVAALNSVQQILKKMELQEIELMYLPTYRLSQDPVELLFGSIRKRLGNNDNPNVIHLACSVRAILSFKLQVCENGNCEAQESLLDKLSFSQFASVSARNVNLEDDGECNEYIIDLDSYMNLSLFVENAVVHIAGFVGRKLIQSISCSDCCAALRYQDSEWKMREDFLLILAKDMGGLFKPSEDAVLICKITERVIRVEQSKGVFKLNSKNIELMVKRECVGRNIFTTLHTGYVSTAFRLASFQLHSFHKVNLISEICQLYLKIRLHFIAKRSNAKKKCESNRNKFTNLVKFDGS